MINIFFALYYKKLNFLTLCMLTVCFKALSQWSNIYSIQLAMNHFLDVCKMEIPVIYNDFQLDSIIKLSNLPWFHGKLPIPLHFQIFKLIPFLNPDQKSGDSQNSEEELTIEVTKKDQLMAFIKMIDELYTKYSVRNKWMYRLIMVFVCYSITFMNQFLMDEEENFMRNNLIDKMLVDQDEGVQTIAIRFAGLLFESADEKEKVKIIDQTVQEIKKKTNLGIIKGLVLIDTLYLNIMDLVG